MQEAPVKGSFVLKYDPSGARPTPIASSPRRVLNGSKARQHARRGLLAELFRATEAFSGTR